MVVLTVYAISKHCHDRRFVYALYIVLFLMIDTFTSLVPIARLTYVPTWRRQFMYNKYKRAGAH
jgi:hypothetical protein